MAGSGGRIRPEEIYGRSRAVKSRPVLITAHVLGLLAYRKGPLDPDNERTPLEDERSHASNSIADSTGPKCSTHPRVLEVGRS